MRAGLRPRRGLLRGGVLRLGELRRRGGDRGRLAGGLRGLRLRDFLGGLRAGDRDRLRDSLVEVGFGLGGGDFFLAGLCAGLFDLLLALLLEPLELELESLEELLSELELSELELRCLAGAILK